MNSEIVFLMGSNDRKHWTEVARINKIEGNYLPVPGLFNSPYRYHEYRYQTPDPALPDGLPEKKLLDGTWGWR